MLIPVYIPEIWVYRSTVDYEWACKGGPSSPPSFRPSPDGEREPVGPFLRTCRHGSDPAFTVIAPDGSALFEKGRAMYLRTPDGKVHDATNALVHAKRRDFGFDLVREGRPIPPPDPAPIPSAPLPRRERRGPAVQLAMFD